MHALRKIGINKRLWLLIGISLIGLLVITAVALSNYRSTLLEEKQSSIKKIVETGYSVLADYQGRAERGEMTLEQAQAAAKQSLKAVRYDQDDYFWINDMQPKMVMHPIKPALEGKDLSGVKDPNGKLLFMAFVETVKKSGEGLVPYLWPKPGSDAPVEKLSYVKGFQPWGWVIGSGIYIDDVQAQFIATATELGIISAVLILLLLVASIAIARSILVPLHRTTEAMRDISEGEGDLTKRLAVRGNDEIGALSTAFNHFVDRIEQTIRKVGDATSRLATAAEELSEITREGNETADRQRSETQQVATAVNEMASTVSEIANSAEQAAVSAGDADSEAGSGRAIVEETSNAIASLAEEVEHAAQVINRLESESEAIGSVLDVIRGIAEQTNLLALNAAIEAARAGEQGRGFAVVADEVRTLASRTQQSTQEIQEMIERLQGGSREAVQAMERGRSTSQSTVEKAQSAGDSLAKIVEAITRISDMNSHIATAAEQQSAVAQEIDKSIVLISEMSEQSANGSQQTLAASRELADLGEQLRGMIQQFKIS